MHDFNDLIAIMARLRSKGGCEWDRAQSHGTLRQYLLEEAHETVDAISQGDPDHLCEELGDLLLQIVFHARIAEEAGTFGIGDVIDRISEKMIRRHPHVFAGSKADSPEAVSVQWEHIKKTVENRTHDSLIGGVPRSFPALVRASKISKKAARAGFDWDNAGQVLEKVDEEIAELKEAISRRVPKDMEHELGDIFFTLVNLARFLDVHPETAMMVANERFERRFRAMEKFASESNISIESADMETLERLWREAKLAVG
jgi:MazG family protein